MLRCFGCFSFLFNGDETQQGRRGRNRNRHGGRRAADNEFGAYDELQLEETTVRADQVAEAARTAERREVAPSLRDESLVARLSLALGAGLEENTNTMDSDELGLEESQKTSLPSSKTFVRTLLSLNDRKVIAVVVESLWNATRHRWRKRETTRLLGMFQLAISKCLSAASQQELSTILVDLPPAVMGDDVAQQSSRVLIDVSRDAREEMMRRRASLSQANRRQVDSAVAAFDAQLKNLEVKGTEMGINNPSSSSGAPGEAKLLHPATRPLKPGSVEPHIALYFDIMISMLLEIPEFDRFRVIMTQMILSKQVPADTTLRTSVIELCFPSRPSTPQVVSGIAEPSYSSNSSAKGALIDTSALIEEEDDNDVGLI